MLAKLWQDFTHYFIFLKSPEFTRSVFIIINKLRSINTLVLHVFLRSWVWRKILSVQWLLSSTLCRIQLCHLRIWTHLLSYLLQLLMLLNHCSLMTWVKWILVHLGNIWKLTWSVLYRTSFWFDARVLVFGVVLAHFIIYLHFLFRHQLLLLIPLYLLLLNHFLLFGLYLLLPYHFLLLLLLLLLCRPSSCLCLGYFLFFFSPLGRIHFCVFFLLTLDVLLNLFYIIFNFLFFHLLSYFLFSQLFL